MSEILREEALWRKEKTPIIKKYVAAHSHLMAEIAGRGFLSLPGFAYEMENDLEAEAKMGLSAVNYKILSETIERELKQKGIDYDHSYKNAVIAWEVEKQEILSAWDAELGLIKQGMAYDDEAQAQLAINVAARSIVFLTAKNAIALEMEAYRKELAELDGQTTTYEAQLASAKLLTAQRKADVIPILEEILQKEQELLVIEGQKAAYYEEYIAAETEVVYKQRTLAPFIAQLAAKNETLAAKITTVEIPSMLAIAAEKVAQAVIAQTKAGYQLQEISNNIAAETSRLTLAEAHRTLNDTKFNNDNTAHDYGITKENEYEANLATHFTTDLNKEATGAGLISSIREETHTIQATTKTTSATTITTKEIEEGTSNTANEANKIRRIAEAQATAKITAGLTHLIG
jgi:hypothetical protein